MRTMISALAFVLLLAGCATTPTKNERACSFQQGEYMILTSPDGERVCISAK